MSEIEIKRSFKVIITGVFSAILTAGFLFIVSVALIPEFGFSYNLFGTVYVNVKGLLVYAIVFYALWAAYKRNEQYHIKKHKGNK